MANYFPIFIPAFTNSSPAVGYDCYIYLAGTSTYTPTYADSTGGPPNEQPVEVDSSGLIVVYGDPAILYKFVVKDLDGNTVHSFDYVCCSWSPAFGTGLDLIGDLTVTGTSTLTGVVTCSTGLTVTTGGITVTGNSTFANNVTITGTTTSTGRIIASVGLTATTGGILISAGGLTCIGNSTITGTLGVSSTLTVSSGGLTVTAGGLTVSSGGATITGTTSITGNTSVTGTLTSSNTLTVSGGGAAVTGNSTITGTLTTSSSITISSGGLVVTAGGVTVTGTSSFSTTVIITTGGLTVTAGGLTCTGNSTITGTLGGLTGLTVASGGVTVTGNSTITGTLDGLTGLTVASGGATVTGNITIINSTTVGASVALREATNNGTNVVTLKAPDNLSADRTFTFPSNASVVGYVPTATDTSGTCTWQAQASSGSFPCEFRLTGLTGTPVTLPGLTTTTIYMTPYKGNHIALYDGAAWAIYTTSEISIAVPATTNSAYDVFCYSNSGTPTLETLVWAGPTGRATDLTTQDGVLVKSGATTRRYLGSFITSDTSGVVYDHGTMDTTGSYRGRCLWNYYNRVFKYMSKTESTDSWTYTTASFRAARNDITNSLICCVGWIEDALHARVTCAANNASSCSVTTGIGLNSTSTSSAITNNQILLSGPSYKSEIDSEIVIAPVVGANILYWLEYSEATGTTTWYGDNGSPTFQKSGIVGGVWC